MKKTIIKQVYLLLSSFIIFIVHLLFVFAKNKPTAVVKPGLVRIEKSSGDISSFLSLKSTLANPAAVIYDSLRLNVLGLSHQAFECAIKGFNNLVNAGKITNDKILSIVDFSEPSSKKRFFVIDLNNYTVLFNTYVAHGVNSGLEYANRFSNNPQSNKSSLGFYETLDTYIGKNGYSLQLQGLERGINDNANRRAIVMHGAEYVSENFIQSRGYIGRSWGCPAIPEDMKKPIIDKIKNGSCLFIYSPDKNYFHHSRILHSAA